jgi:hypothetical protein
MAVVNLRGTSGSGKSTVVRRLMQLCRTVPTFQPKRRQPIAYICRNDSFPSRSPLYVPGHYEGPCGGCDTIKTTQDVYELVEWAAMGEMDVVFEGIMFQDGALARFLEFNRSFHPTVIELSTSIEDCVASVQARRDARGDERPFNPKNTIDRAERVRRGCAKLRDNGVTVLTLDREAAYQKCLELLGWV